MAGYRIPCALGNGMSNLIDAGTLVRSFTPLPGIVYPLEHAKQWVRQQVRQGVSAVIQGAGTLAYETVMQELRALRGGIEEKLAYISRLPKELRDQVAYDFFASFFEHYLPKKFLHNYIWGNGKPIKLTVQEMADCNPVISLTDSSRFNHRIDLLRLEADKTKKAVPYPFTLEMVAGAGTNGTLGQFTVAFSGNIVVQPDGNWVAEGTMQFSDTWDFDPKDAETGGRSAAGEKKTRFANQFLPGTAFDISSESTAFKQTQADDLVVWTGGRPVGVPDKVSKADLAVLKPDSK